MYVFMIKEGKVFDKYMYIWEKISNIIKKKLIVKHIFIYSKKYLIAKKYSIQKKFSMFL